jgi:hypothetical protein
LSRLPHLSQRLSLSRKSRLSRQILALRQSPQLK